MNKKLYNILGYIPVIGRIVQIKTNFFAFKPSPFMAEFTKTNDYKVLTDWLKSHPDQVISPKKAMELIAKQRKK